MCVCVCVCAYIRTCTSTSVCVCPTACQLISVQHVQPNHNASSKKHITYISVHVHIGVCTCLKCCPGGSRIPQNTIFHSLHSPFDRNVASCTVCWPTTHGLLAQMELAWSTAMCAYSCVCVVCWSASEGGR